MAATKAKVGEKSQAIFSNTFLRFVGEGLLFRF